MSPSDTLSLDELERLQGLAGLQLSACDAHTLRSDLGAILRMVDQMRSVDTDGVEPLVHPLELRQRLRDDCAQAPDPTRAAAEQRQYSQAVRQNLYLVPRVVG